MENLHNQAPMDFGNEVPYVFGYLPINAELNREIFVRAVERAKQKKGRAMFCCDCCDPLNDEEAHYYGNRCEQCEREWLAAMKEKPEQPLAN